MFELDEWRWRNQSNQALTPIDAAGGRENVQFDLTALKENRPVNPPVASKPV